MSVIIFTKGDVFLDVNQKDVRKVVMMLKLMLAQIVKLDIDWLTESVISAQFQVARFVKSKKTDVKNASMAIL
jgi:hypothetical protein